LEDLIYKYIVYLSGPVISGLAHTEYSAYHISELRMLDTKLEEHIIAP